MTDAEIYQKLSEINTQLNNHIVHISGDIAAIKNDIAWIKGGCIRHRTELKSGEDEAQNTNIDWLKWIIQYISIAIIGGALALILQHVGK